MYIWFVSLGILDVKKRYCTREHNIYQAFTSLYLQVDSQPVERLHSHSVLLTFWHRTSLGNKLCTPG